MARAYRNGILKKVY